jgi:hypothetical protein
MNKTDWATAVLSKDLRNSSSCTTLKTRESFLHMKYTIEKSFSEMAIKLSVPNWCSLRNLLKYQFVVPGLLFMLFGGVCFKYASTTPRFIQSMYTIPASTTPKHQLSQWKKICFCRWSAFSLITSNLCNPAPLHNCIKSTFRVPQARPQYDEWWQHHHCLDIIYWYLWLHLSPSYPSLRMFIVASNEWQIS